MRRIRLPICVFLMLVMVSWYAPGAFASLTATTVFEVQTGGSDTLNSGFYDTATTGKPTDLTTNTASGNTAAPIVKSASYNFNNTTDTNNWLYQSTSGGASGWQAGWYKITACSGNNATLDAAVGHVILSNYTTNTVAGISTAATPTSGTWSIDYSQQAGVQFSLTGLSSSAANAIILTASASKAMVGNGIQVTGGTNATTGFYVVQACTAGVSLTVDRNWGTGAVASGTAGIGGALGSPGQAGAIAVAQNQVWVKSGSYSVTSATFNISGGCVDISAAGSTTNPTRLMGYGTLRGDNATNPVLTLAAAVTSATVVRLGNGGGSNFQFFNFTIDGANNTSSLAYYCAGRSITCYNCIFQNAVTGVKQDGGGFVGKSQIISCTSPNGTASPSNNTNVFFDCLFSACGSVVGPDAFYFCIIRNGTSHGYNSGGNLTTLVNCTVYGNAGSGIYVGGTPRATVVNCISYNNVAFGYRLDANFGNVFLINCAGGANSSNIQDTTVRQVGFVTLTSDPFVNAAGGNFALNRKSTGGALCQTAGIPGTSPGLSATTGYLAIGAVETNRAPLRSRWR